jgi:ATP-dependent RNA helicase DBP3
VDVKTKKHKKALGENVTLDGQPASTARAGAAAQNGDDSAKRQAKIANKLLQKQVRKSAASTDEQLGSNGASTLAHEDSAKKHWKKKAKKHKDAVAPAVASEQPHASTEDEEKTAKKCRKAEKLAAQRAARAGTSGATAFAAVGDVERAKTSPAIVKNVYSEAPALSSMSADKLAAFQAERGIMVEGSDLRPVTAFEHLGFDKALLHAVQGFAAPSPVQAQCWPLVLSGRDLIGIAATGSGAQRRHNVPQHAAGSPC